MASGFLISYSAFAIEWIPFLAYLLFANRLSSGQGLTLLLITTLLASIALAFPGTFLARHPDQLSNAHPFVLALLVLAPLMPIALAIRVALVQRKHARQDS